MQTLQQEFLDHFIVLGKRHLDYLAQEYVKHYNTERPHQAVGNVPVTDAGLPDGPGPPGCGEVECRERLGGLLNFYQRAA